MRRLTLDDELQIACMLDIKDGIVYQYQLFCKLFRTYRDQKACLLQIFKAHQQQKQKIESLEEWIKILERQLERYKRHELEK